MSLLGNRNLCSLTLLLVLCALTLAGCGKSERSREAELPPMNANELLGKHYVENNLSEDQRRILLSGGGSSDDTADLITNITNDGYLHEVAAYIEYLERVKK